MKNSFLTMTFNRLAAIGAAPDDSEELKLQKSLLVICSFPFILAGIGWGIMYIAFGEKNAAIIPLSYSVFSIASIDYFRFTRKFRIFSFSQLFLILVLPFALMLLLGGFVGGSAVILWSLISPLGAMLFSKQSKALKWLFAFIILVFISIIIQPWLRVQNNLSTAHINLFFIINISAVGSLIFLMFYYFVGKKNFFKARSEALLLNILPAEIAEELKTTGMAEAKHFSEVTVMFTDFEGFTKISEKLTPSELVEEIHACFTAFDNIISKHNIEKIKTIGDSYMCAGGLPVANKTHAFDVVSAAAEIRRFMQEHSQEKKSDGKESFSIRIGIHTGPVVAGIVGIRKFAYDIWGDTVNIASRMESSGKAGKINISGSTFNLVKNEFNCSYRGKIPAKNKGEIDMYFVI